MDVCTLVVATTVTLQACFTAPACHVSQDGKANLCTPAEQTACPQPAPHYDCVRSDGSRYERPE